jgi:nicotinate phosphoribosyltransferase
MFEPTFSSKDGALLTDLYQLTMAYGYWQQGMAERPAFFSLFFRKPPFGQHFALAAGLAQAISWLENWQFSPSSIQFLGGLKGQNDRPLFPEAFLNYLQRLKLNCDIQAVPEGTAVFPYQPILTVKGPLLQAQLLETALLNILNFATLTCTKAARIVEAAGEGTVLEFGLRRAQGPDGGLTASRAAYLGGCAGTSNVWAGKLYHIPVVGTHAHSWIMSFEEELQAFSAYADSLPSESILLVDTYDTLQGVQRAIEVGKQLQEKGHQLRGVRLDSGDLVTLSIEARKQLDAAGMHQAIIVASGDLDEYRIRELREAGASIDAWGVGTRLATAYDQPALGGVYKLAALQDDEGKWHPKLKRSEESSKSSDPGWLQTRRFFKETQPRADVLYNQLDPLLSIIDTTDRREHPGPRLRWDTGQDLLVPIFEKGKRCYDIPPLTASRNWAKQQQSWFSTQPDYPHVMESRLAQLRHHLIQSNHFGGNEVE